MRSDRPIRFFRRPAPVSESRVWDSINSARYPVDIDAEGRPETDLGLVEHVNLVFIPSYHLLELIRFLELLVKQVLEVIIARRVFDAHENILPIVQKLCKIIVVK